jgi:hypothetical protein
MAHAAPPGRSFHEQVVYGYSAAVDYVGDLKWFGLNCEAYGIEQATWGGEVWHGQFTEFPHSVSQWQAQGSPQPQKWALPGTTPPSSLALLGPDVSSYDEGLVAPSPPGVGFGIARASIGLKTDQTASNTLAWCRTAKVPFVAYHFVFQLANHPAAEQAATFHTAVGGDSSIPCMLDWEVGPTDYCHPGGPEQNPTWADVVAVAEAVRKLGHTCALVYTARWYWLEQGQPNMGGVGLDLVNAQFGAQPWPTGTPWTIYTARGADTGPGWQGYGGLTPIIWQYTQQATWGNRSNIDFNAYVGKASDLGKWFTTWGASTPLLEDDDNMLFISRLDSNPNLIVVGDGITSRRIRADEIDELTAALSKGVGPQFHDPTVVGAPVIRDVNKLPKVSDDWQQLFGIETTESVNQPG